MEREWTLMRPASALAGAPWQTRSPPAMARGGEGRGSDRPGFDRSGPVQLKGMHGGGRALPCGALIGYHP